MIAAMLAGSVMIANAKEEKVGWFNRTFCALTWEQVQTVNKTPKSVCAAVRHQVRYAEDIGDNWTTGKETWDKKKGDCEDYAACVVDLCQAAGIEASIHIYCPKGSWEAHAVVIGSWNGQLWISSNGWYENIESMDEAKKVVAKAAGWRHREILTASPEEAKRGYIDLALDNR